MCVKFLLEYKADSNILDNYGYAPLHDATACGATDVVSLLLEYGAKPKKFLKKRTSVRTEVIQYWTPLHLACERNFPDILRLFLDQKAPVNRPNNTGITPLHIAASQRCIDCLNLLIDYGADIEAVDDDKEPPLFPSIQARLLQHAQKLVNGRTVTMSNKNGETCLHLAAKLGFPEFLSFFLDNNANIHACDNSGNSSLHIAVIHMHKECVRVLLEHGADPLQRNEDNQSPFVLCTGEIAAMMKTFLEQNKKSVRAEAMDKSPRSTKTAPSRLRSALSPSQMAMRDGNNNKAGNLNFSGTFSGNLSKSPSRFSEKSPSRLSERSLAKKMLFDEQEEARLKMTKQPNPPMTVRMFQDQITDSIKKTEDEVRGGIAELRRLVELLKEDLNGN
ncbi:hypothetical protein TRFO_36862 [Tritrichomonas foetus]|uniref:Uncharacterized protein n=1 Tax=Tritrichomonas foetus TaxID=1144522 RepID=A0A1J4JEC3_9EUKA|nr:hypothetical protein TRFO_36862 [Tritrichomonas foetus]|eukprot:OHS97001.1 hypothetical protein TRFO_36862 [Tritrichomonas foetus]